MEILAHRGTWARADERNTAEAFERAWAAGHGIETDLRDLDGQVVVSHDPPSTQPSRPMGLDELLSRWVAGGSRGRLALNIKADGLAVPIAKALAEAGALTKSFVFDMSVPDQLAHATTGVPVFARWSDIEPAPVMTPGTAGLWLDAFTVDGWWSPDAVHEHLVAGRDVVLVSPELHRRDHEATWRGLREAGLHRRPGFSLCTDHPDAAQEYFA